MPEQTPFRPRPNQKKSGRHINIEVENAKYLVITDAAQRCGVSIKDFVRQAVDYALDHLKVPDARSGRKPDA